MSENMDSACRKSRLKQLLDLGTEIRKNKDEDPKVFEKITSIIKETDKMILIGDEQERARNTTEVLMDAQVVQMSHELIGEVMQKVITNEFVEEEWINAIVAMVYKNDNENWDPVAEIATNICKLAKFSPSFFTNYDFNVDPTNQTILKERQRRQKTAKADEVRPENLSQIEQRDGTSSKQITTTIYKKICRLYIENKQQPIPYYKLIIDPDNFMNTVDNAFQVAFLVRDKSVQILNDEDDDLPTVKPISKQEQANAPNETVQAICTLNTIFIQKMTKKYKIKEALLTRN